MQTILLLQFSSCWSVDLFRCVRLKQVSLNLAAGQPRASSLASWLASQESSSHGSLTVLTPLLFKCSKIQGLLAVWHLSHELAGLAHQASVDKQLQKTNVETTMQAMHTERKLFVVQTQTPPQTTTIKCRHDRLDPALAASGKQKRKTKARNQDETAKIISWWSERQAEYPHSQNWLISTAGLEPATYGCPFHQQMLEVHRATFAPRRKAWPSIVVFVI